MRFDIITIFPKVVEAYFDESILKRAIKKKLIDVRIHDLRKFAKDKHHKVDDKAYGGGPGMVLKIEPLIKAVGSILRIANFQFPISKQISKSKSPKSKTLIILLSASGKQFNSKIAAGFAKKYKRIILISGHYEGIDERIKQVVKAYGLRLMALSVGPYVLTGGELPAMVIADAVSRHISGVLGKAESLEERRNGIGVLVYTRPEIFKYRGKKYAVPKVLLSGNHQKIDMWRRKHKNV